MSKNESNNPQGASFAERIDQLTESLQRLKAAGEAYEADKANDLTGSKLRELSMRVATLRAELATAEQELLSFQRLGRPEDKFAAAWSLPRLLYKAASARLSRR